MFKYCCVVWIYLVVESVILVSNCMNGSLNWILHGFNSKQYFHFIIISSTLICSIWAHMKFQTLHIIGLLDNWKIQTPIVCYKIQLITNALMLNKRDFKNIASKEEKKNQICLFFLKFGYVCWNHQKEKLNFYVRLFFDMSLVMGNGNNKINKEELILCRKVYNNR